MANLTRIQNNQIYDSTINAQSKIASGSITGNLLATNLTLNSNVTILGNLQVANSYTQLNSVNTYINDPIVVFNNGYVGSIAGYDIGILVNRNSTSLTGYSGGVNTFLGWSEAESAFVSLVTTETGTTLVYDYFVNQWSTFTNQYASDSVIHFESGPTLPPASPIPRVHVPVTSL